MCTVTLVPLPETEKGFVLTSNRDEAVLRKTLQPDFYTEEGVKMLYPRDVEAGGTWIGLSERQRTVCLLNGGFEKHVRKPPYRKSRGVVVKELLAAAAFEEWAQNYDYQGIEPFTAVVVEYEQELRFRELVWDGVEKHITDLPLAAGIWSSALLYSAEEISLRKQKFETFKMKHQLLAKDLLDFHSSTGEAGEEGLIIDRGFLKTCSITQIIHGTSGTSMWYRDLPSGMVTENSL